MRTRVHATVSGLVQGVGFRWFVRERADGLGLSGYVRNRVDGSVELEAEGERESVERLLVDVRRGPRSAMVTETALEWLPATGESTTFAIR